MAKDFILVETFSQFICATSDHYRLVTRNKGWRAGQTAFNMLVVVRPDIAELLRGSDMDPFYNDSALPEFYDFVQRHWRD